MKRERDGQLAGAEWILGRVVAPVDMKFNAMFV